MKEELLLILLSFALVRSDVNYTFILQYENYTIPDLRHVCLNYEIAANVSEKCAEQLEVVCGNSTLLATMLDATSKFPWTGLGYSSRMDYGNFDECMTVNHKYAGGKILGQHCLVGLVIPDLFGNASDQSSYYQLAVCKPDACSAADFNTITSSMSEGFPSLFVDNACQTVETDTEITASDIVTITIFVIVLLLMTVSTIYDIYLYQMNSKSPHPLILAFSVFSNGKKLFHVPKNSKEQIQTFHGIKVISIMWIAAGHGFSGWQQLSVTNADDTLTWLQKRYSVYISAGPLAVDSFFFISGFLLAYQYLKQKPKPLKDQVMSVPRMYIHRYLRLTPAMLMVYLVTISVFKHLGSGPIYSYGSELFAQPCRDYWWQFFLYIQNYALKIDDFCIVPTWYLAADMQMFLLSPLVLIPLSLNLRKSSGFMVSMVELLILNLFCIALPMTLKLVVRDYKNEYDTHSRLINYFIGVMLGVFMRVKQDKPFLYFAKKLKKHISITNLLVWIFILLEMLTIILCFKEVELNHGYESRVVFDSLMRPAWCIGLSWIVYSSYHGYGGIVNWILSGPLMQVLGRLTYCIYLLHGTVESYYIVLIRGKLYFSDYNVFYIWCGSFTVTMLLAIFWTLAFESPLIIIEKYLLGGGNQRSKQIQNGATDTTEKKENIS